MRRKVSVFIIITICFLLQTTLFQTLSFASISPNLLIIVVSSFGFMRGKKEGLYIGFACGLLLDIFGSGILGFYALLYMYIGYINGCFRKMFYPEDLKLPMLLIAGSDLGCNLLIYFFLFLFRNRYHFQYYLWNIMLPELVYTMLITIFLYVVILKVNQRLETLEKRSAKEVFRMFFKSRLAVAAVLMTVLFGVLLWRVFYLQIVKGEKYQDNYTLKIVKERTLNSTRGNIYDRNGELLAYNELAYSITIEDNGSYSSTDKKNESLNAEIAQVITALEKNGDAITDDFKIDRTGEGTYEFNVTGTSLKRFLADVYGESSYDDLGMNKKLGYDTSQATVDQVMDYLRNDCYGIDDSYSDEMAFKITIVRFAMAQNAYQKYIATTIATNVSEESVAYISELR